MNIVSLDEHRDSPVDPYERTRNGQKELRELAEAALGLPYLYDGEYRMDILNDDIWFGSLRFNARTEKWSIEVDATNHPDIHKRERRAHVILLVACKIANEKWRSLREMIAAQTEVREGMSEFVQVIQDSAAARRIA